MSTVAMISSLIQEKFPHLEHLDQRVCDATLRTAFHVSQVDDATAVIEVTGPQWEEMLENTISVIDMISEAATEIEYRYGQRISSSNGAPIGYRSLFDTSKMHSGSSTALSVAA